MGYKHKSKQYRLRYEDKPGLEVVMKSCKIRKFIEMTELSSKKVSDLSEDESTLVFRLVSDHLVSWTLEVSEGEHEGDPVPATYDGIIDQDFDFIFEIFISWMNGMQDVKSPLPSGLSSTGTSLEEQLDLAKISQNLSS